MKKLLTPSDRDIPLAITKTIKKLILPAVFIIPRLSYAVETWVGPSSITAAAYNTAANWSPAAIPGASEAISFTTAVTITGSLPITSGNDIAILGTGAVTINTGVTVSAGNISVTGAGGSLSNSGTLNALNVTYGNVAGATITNNGSMSLNNLNVGNGTLAGNFNNNGILAVTGNIVAEEGTFSNNPGGTVTTNGMDIRSGGTVLNGGTITSAGSTSTAQVSLLSGGTFTNQSSGVLKIDISAGNVYALDVAGSFSNNSGGQVSIGHNPYNSGAQGVIIRTTGNFSNAGIMRFQIDPAKCVFTDNHGAGGSFSTSPVIIISGSACGVATVGPLPITLVSFSGTASDYGSALLSWTINNDDHELQECAIWQSADGVSFNKVTTVNAGQRTDYTADVPQPVPSAWYKLDMINKNGQHSYSAIINVKSTKTGNDAAVLYPTVVNQGSPVTIVYTATQAAMIQIMITGVNGSASASYTCKVNAGQNTISLATGNLSQGTYFVRIYDNATYSKMKMIVIQ